MSFDISMWIIFLCTKYPHEQFVLVDILLTLYIYKVSQNTWFSFVYTIFEMKSNGPKSGDTVGYSIGPRHAIHCPGKIDLDT